MRQSLFIGNILLLLTFFLLFSRCKYKPKTIQAENSKNHYNYTKDQAGQIVKKFAIAYQPDSMPYEGIGRLDKVPDSVVAAFRIIRLIDSSSHNKWLTVIFLKLSLDHLRCCHQGYEVRNKVGGIDSIADPLFYEYVLSTNLFDIKNERIEFVNSRRLADRWLEKNPTLATDPEIQEIITAMKPIEDSITKGLYW